MTLNQLNDIVDKKIEQNDEKIVITFFELVVKENLGMDELTGIEYLIMQRLENLGYTVYKRGEKYSYYGDVVEVPTSELIVAIKK